jgi:hypothetical protein
VAQERFVEICAMPSAEVVETDHRLAERKQIFEEVRPDEACDTRDKPHLGLGAYLMSNASVVCGAQVVTVDDLAACFRDRRLFLSRRPWNASAPLNPFGSRQGHLPFPL